MSDRYSVLCNEERCLKNRNKCREHMRFNVVVEVNNNEIFEL